MKKINILLILLFCINSLFAQWIEQNSGSSDFLTSVYFTDEHTGYVSGYGGKILKTTDGGLNWSYHYLDGFISLFSIDFTDSNTGYAVGHHSNLGKGIILKTIDGGVSWTQQIIEVMNLWLFSVCFPSPIIGYACGNKTILKTTNAGLTWTSTTLGGAHGFTSIFFTDVNTGYLVGYGGEIWKTINGGSSWESKNSGTYINLNSVFFTEANTGYVVGGNPTATDIILKTIDAGETWTNLTLGTTNWLYGVHFPNSSTGYAVGENGTIIKTINGGNSWITQTSGTLKSLNAVYFSNENLGYAVGDSGIIVKTTNGGGVGFNELNYYSPIVSIYPNPFTNKFTVELSTLNDDTRISIFTMSGKELIEQQIKNCRTVIDGSYLPKGVYFLQLLTKKSVKVEKITKK